jgi:large subunit ribosomal protein L37Ae
MGKTKKVGSTGKFGVRYGRRIRQRILEVDASRKENKSCQNCLKPGLVRLSAGIWKCKKCGAKFAGKAYKPY